MIKVLVADCDSKERLDLEQAITEETMLDLCGSTGNGKELLTQILQKHPDVVVMDLVLPYMDGISVMETLQKELHGTYMPIVIILTRIQSEMMMQAAFAAGATYYILKPYDMDAVISRIESAFRTVERVDIVGESKMILDGGKETLDREIDRHVSAAGVPHHIKGYRYLNTAIYMCVQDMDKLNGVTKVLYPSIAKQYNTTPSRVERAIRHAIEVACTRTIPSDDSEMYQFLITPDGKRPTNSEFIAFMSDRIRLEGYIA